MALYATCTACPQTYIQNPCWNDIWVNNGIVVPTVILLCVGCQGRITHPGQLHGVESGTAAPQSVSASQHKHSPAWFKNTLTLLAGTPAPAGLSFKLLPISKELFMGLGRLKRFRNFFRFIIGHPLLSSTLDVAASPTWLCRR